MLQHHLKQLEIPEEVGIHQLFPGEDKVPQFTFDSEFAQEIKSKVKEIFINKDSKKPQIKATLYRCLEILTIFLLGLLGM